MTMLTGTHLIAGRPAAGSGTKFTAFDPTTGQPVGPTYHEATDAEINAALRAAADAFDEYAAMPATRRAEFLRAIADEIETLGDELLKIASLETALPLPRVTGERARTTGQLRLFAELIENDAWKNIRLDTARPDRQPLPKPDLRRTVVPLGPVIVFGSSNFPFAYAAAGGDTASALAAGCPVVFKGHPAHPGTAELTAAAVTRAAEKTSMPAGVFSALHGTSPAMSLALVKHQLTTAVGFTGSLRAGRALFDAAHQRPVPIPVYAEMGSVNPVVLLPEALEAKPAELANGVWSSVTLGVGQFCTSPGVIVARAGAALEAFVAEVERLAAKAQTGTMLYAGLAESFNKGRDDIAGRANVRTIGTTAATTGKVTPGAFAVDGPTFLADERLRHELFGPSTVIVSCGSDRELLDVAKSFDGQLTASVHGTGDDFAVHKQVVNALVRVAGRVIFNGYPTGVEVCPAMQHGGPYPASTAPATTSVGTAAIDRWVRPVCYQNCPHELLPAELRDDARGVRIVDGVWKH